MSYGVVALIVGVFVVIVFNMGKKDQCPTNRAYENAFSGTA